MDSTESLHPARDALLQAQHQDTVGALTINRVAQRVAFDGHRIDLRPLEYKCLSLLMHKAGSAVTRKELLESVYFEFGTMRTQKLIDVTICRIRSAIRKVAPGGNPIITIRGKGYLIERSEQ